MHDYVVALAADYGYVTALETTLKSIFYHTPNVHVYLANMDIPPEWFRNINQKLSPVGSQLHDLKIDLNQMAIGKVSWQHINGYSYVRIYLPQLIEAKRILYLDSDVIVRHSLWPLLKFDLQGQPVGMAHEINCAPYNTGVLLIDYERWQTADLTRRCIDFFSSHENEIDNGDQTVLNRVCEGAITELPARFNNQLGLERVGEQFGWPPYDQLVVNDAVIDHYTGSDKPWNFLSTVRGRIQWWEYHNLEWQMIGNHLSVISKSVRPKLLLYTAWAELNQLEELIRLLPEVDFEIASPVFMSFELKRLAAYPNVNLHQTILSAALTQLIDTSVAMLDLTLIQRDESVQERFFATGKPILALQREDYQNNQAMFFPTPEDLAGYVRKLIKEM